MHNKRVERLQQALRSQGLDGFIVTHHVDLYYFSGTMQGGFLAVPADGEPIFYVRRSLTRAREESALRIEPLGSMRTWGERLAADLPAFAGGARLAAAFDTLTADGYERLRRALPEAEWANGSAMIRTIRSVKDEGEIARIRRAAKVVDEALAEALPKLKEGMREIELLAEIEYGLRKRGHLGLMRLRSSGAEMVTGVAASGEAASKPSAFDGPAGGEGLSTAFSMGAGWSPIQRGEPILLDIGCNIEGYVVDQTRTAVIGELPEDLAEAYGAAEKILRAVEAQLKPGAVCEELYARSLSMAEDFGLADHFMGYREDQVKFLGHGIGLELDEWPVLAKGFATPLEPGMVIAIEPKFTFPGRGVVGIENSYLITTDGFEKLTLSPEGVWTLQTS